ncbi:MAG TPA: cellulose binding domain-containing protein [Actinoplanes sp.]|nr:cellulose binding domain-containing protein [Actinoplanes sp.]
MIEPSPGVRRDLPDPYRTGEGATPHDPGTGAAWNPPGRHQDYPEYAPEPLPARSTGETAPQAGPDLGDHRYDALAAWNESAQTMTMAAVGSEPRPAYHDSFDPASFSDTVPRHSVPPARTVRRALRTRRERIAVAVAVAGFVLAGGAAAVWAGGSDPDQLVTIDAAPGLLTTGPATDPTDGPVAGDDTAASPTPSARASTSASPKPSPSLSVTRSPAVVTTLPAGRISRGPARVSAGPVAGSPALSASYGYADGSGSIEVVNTGTADATGWTVGLTVPGGETVTVTSGDVTVLQSGSSVTFRPSGGAVPAAGLIAFSFAVDPVPAEEPTGCTIDGHSCG